MVRNLLCGLLVLAVTQVAPTEAPRPEPIEELLRRAVRKSPAGALARARVVNQASRRVDELIASLKHADDDVRLSAAWALRFSAAKQKVLAPLGAALLDENFSVSRAAAVSLKDFNAVEQPLRKLIKHPETAMRWRGVINVDYMVLAGLMDDVATAAVRDPVDFIRADAAWTLRHGRGPRVVEALVKCLADPSGRVRGRARSSLLRGRMSGDLRRRGSPVRRRVLAGLLKILESHRGKAYATSTAVDVLNELVVRPIGPDPAKWRKLVAGVEGGK